VSDVRVPTAPTAPTATAAATGPVRPRRAVVADWLTLTGRCLRLSSRQVDAMLTALMLPVMLMLMFVYLFGGAIHTGTRYVTYVVPGVILLCAGFGSATTAVSVSQDMTGGVVDRFRSMDVGAVPVLGGHVVASVLRNAASTALVFGVAFLIGFRSHAGLPAWLAAAGVLLLFVLAVSWLSAAVGLLARSPEAANGFTFLVMFLPYASSAFVPIDTMPSWLHGFAGHQPTTPVVETIRGLLLDTGVGTRPWVAVAWCCGVLAGSVALCALLFRRRTA
jgi:ABC-2 type transport system permease protein